MTEPRLTPQRIQVLEALRTRYGVMAALRWSKQPIPAFHEGGRGQKIANRYEVRIDGRWVDRTSVVKGMLESNPPLLRKTSDGKYAYLTNYAVELMDRERVT
jgi:hypothetical protein